MNDTVPSVEQCDVCDKASLASYRTKKEKWWRWLRTDNHNALWPQIYSMIIADMTFRTLAIAADADKESGLHSPIIRRGIVQGHASTQGLSIRRLVDNRHISLRRLLRDIKKNLHLITRENYVSGEGLPYDFDVDASWRPHVRFDQLAGTQPESRSRSDRIPKRLIEILEGWLDVKEICEVVTWTNVYIAHAADQEARPDTSFARLTPLTMDNIAASQRYIVRAAEAVSAYLLDGPIHGAIVPVFQYSQFFRFEMIVDQQAEKKAEECWHELAEERDQWTRGLWDEARGRWGD
jgi:hypothetical protein